jgi:hypothetical protein
VHAGTLRPGLFCQYLINALAASEGRRRRRKRDTTPDAIGMAVKRALLERAAAEDPEPEAFDAWLLERVLEAPASGPVQAMCAEIRDEYIVAALDPAFGTWLASGAYSADADDETDDARPRRGGRRDD